MSAVAKKLPGGSLAKPISNDSLVNQVISRITESLINNELAPGDRLPTENAMVISLGVGKSSVREAVKILQAMGMVEVRRGDGTFVAQSAPDMSINPMLYQLLLDHGSTQNVFELRELFEPAYTVLAMLKATEEDYANIERVMGEFEQAAEQERQTGEDDVRFHDAILHATHNPYVIRIGTTILKLFMASVDRSVRRVPNQAITDHRRIYQAMRNGDSSKVYEAVIHSFEGWKHNQNGGVKQATDPGR